MSINGLWAAEALSERFPQWVVDTQTWRGETTVMVRAEGLREIARYMKDELGFMLIVDVTAVDWLGIKRPRFEVVYLLHKLADEFNEGGRIRLKVPVDEHSPEVPSVTTVWKGAEWLEREVYDMFGIRFRGHPDLRRILMPEDYDHFPLRKDFDVRNREPSKRSFKRALKEVGADLKG